MADKKKEVTSKGGNSFLTIQSGESLADEQNKTEDTAAEKKEKKKKAPAKPQKPAKSEEERIEDFTNNVTQFLDKIETFRFLVNSIFQKGYSEGVDRLKLMVLKGKYKFLKPVLPLMIVIQKVNERWFKGPVIPEPEEAPEEENKAPAEPKKPVTFLELAEKSIIFTDNRKKPLYTLEQLKDKSGYVASEAVVTPMIIENIMAAFHEVAPKARSIPTPESGRYANISMSEVMANISEPDIMAFLEYVRNFPRGYVGKNYRITESFAGWAVSGTPDD